MAELTESLEYYRIEQLKAKEDQYKIKAKKLTETEYKQALDFLKEKNLMKRTNIEIGKSGIIGEESNRLLMYLIFTSRKLKQPLHVVSLGASGTGKTHLQENVGELIPTEDKIEITTLSENAFYYFGKRSLQNIFDDKFTDGLIWEKDFLLDNEKLISRIHYDLENVNIYKKED